MTKQSGGRLRRVKRTPAFWHGLALLLAQNSDEALGHRWAVWYCEDGDIVIIQNSHPYRASSLARDEETARFRQRLADAGVGELAYATYPPPGEEDAGYSYGMLLDAGEDQLDLVRDLYDEERGRTITELLARGSAARG
jgi:hypothetical protein